MNCISPFGVIDKEQGVKIWVPCGKCVPCVKRRQSAWSFRLMQQDKVSTQAHFVTLTYDNAHVPITPNKFLTVSKTDLQLFFKRLRYYEGKISEKKIRYYAASEYGGQTSRPHYHIILFDCSPDSVIDAWKDRDGVPMGTTHFGSVSAASIGYSLKYISKKGYYKRHARDDRFPEFALMSKGLGKNYLTPTMIKWHEAELVNRMYCTTADGIKIAMPRYYKDKIYTKAEREHVGSLYAARVADDRARIIASYDGDWYYDKAVNDLAMQDRQRAIDRLNDKL